MEGWIKIHRKIQSHWIWKDPIKFQWWIDILMTVNFVDEKTNIGFELFECKRGQSIKSLQTWAERWKTSKDTARNFLKLLEKDGMILHENIGKSTRITVYNYDSYQYDLHDSQTQTKRKPNANQTQTHSNKEEKEEKEKKVSKEVDIHEKTKFDIFNDWLKENYPNISKMSKQMTESNLNTLIDKYGRDNVYDIFMEMENKKGLTKLYDSVYYTANNWLKRKK
jgi:hypothetical protein